nr:MAG TPA: hypothetical protein [Caudoviricetes sp.]
MPTHQALSSALFSPPCFTAIKKPTNYGGSEFC